jgi:hypothetical protein
MSSVDLYEIAAPDGRRFKIEVPSTATVVKERAAVFVGDRQQAELLGHVLQTFEARDTKGASLGFYASAFDAVGAIARLLEWKPTI